MAAIFLSSWPRAAMLSGAPPGRPRLARRTPASAALEGRRTPAVVDSAETIDAEFFLGDSRPIMLFDGVCNLCNGGVRFVRHNDRHRRIRYEALQSDAGRKLLKKSGRAPDDISSVVLVEKDRFIHLKTSMGRAACQRMRLKLDLSLPKSLSQIRIEQNSSWSYIKSEAVLRIMEYLDLPFPQMALLLKFVPLFARDFAYDNVANNRYALFGRTETESCEI